jgi:hypothetical protein
MGKARSTSSGEQRCMEGFGREIEGYLILEDHSLSGGDKMELR